jgi:rod shape-determining protein MreB
MTRDLAIDLGTANTLVYARGRGVVVDQPTVIAINRRNGDVLAMGAEAYSMIGRTPGHIVAERPLRGGAINDFDTTAKLLRLILQQAGRSRFARTRVLICVPTAVTEVERRAVEEAALQAGAASAYLLEEPMAAAIGSGLPVHEPIGSMVVDVGGGTSEVAIISLGGVVVSRSVRTGGFDFDGAIQTHVRRTYAVAIGERTAEAVKIAIASAYPFTDEPVANVRGRELATGLPRNVEVGAAEIRAALEDQISGIVEAAVDALGECPPELTQDILDNGMSLVGGGALLHGLDARISAETGIDVRVIDAPLQAVVNGAGRTLDSLDELRHLFAS